MSDFIPKSNAGAAKGLGPKAQKLQAMRDKAAKAAGNHSEHGSAGGGAKALTGVKKTSFQRKAT